MKQIFTLLALGFGLLNAGAQTVLTDFETFTLSPNTAYTPTTSTPFQTPHVKFDYKWDAGFNYWSGGFSFTNKQDSSTAGFGNLYGVKPLKGYNGSGIYVVGQDKGKISLTIPQTTLGSFYVTNTTYAYKSIRNGDQFAKKFGGASGNDPDFFKIVVKGYLNGALKNDSVEFYLADYRFTNNTQDYVLKTWELVNTAPIGAVDSVKIFLRSSDNGASGMNTPAFFAIDNLSVILPNSVGLASQPRLLSLSVYPNPASAVLNVKMNNEVKSEVSLTLKDAQGKTIYAVTTSEQESRLDFADLAPGMYFLEVSSEEGQTVKRIIKN